MEPPPRDRGGRATTLGRTDQGGRAARAGITLCPRRQHPLRRRILGVAPRREGALPALLGRGATPHAPHAQVAEGFLVTGRAGANRWPKTAVHPPATAARPC